MTLHHFSFAYPVKSLLLSIMGNKLLSAVMVLFGTWECTNICFYEPPTGILVYSPDFFFSKLKIPGI